jgi:hypothetical protein
VTTAGSRVGVEVLSLHEVKAAYVNEAEVCGDSRASEAELHRGTRRAVRSAVEFDEA